MQVKGTDKRAPQAEIVTMDDLVPAVHLLRAVAAAIDFDYVYGLVEEKYSTDTGRPSIDPVVLVKMVLIQFMFGIRSMRQTVQEIEVNAAYRWFLGFSWQDKVPHFTTFGKNYKRRFEGSELFEQIFAKVLEACYLAGYVKGEEVFVDATHIKASANRNKKLKQKVRHEAHVYARELSSEINADREAMEKDPFDDDDSGEEGEVTQSATDPESGMFVKGEHERNFAYCAQTACNRHGFVLGYAVVPGNVHDSKSFWGLYERIRSLEASYLIADSAYKTPAILRRLFYDDIVPVMPYTRPKTKDGYFTKQDYVYDTQNDCYTCPAGQTLRHSTTNRDGYREYRSRAKICRQCPCRMQCTQSKNAVKLIQRHVWQEFVDTAENIRRTPEGKELYKRRKETIERVFADAKEKHGMRYTQYRGLAKVKMQVGLTFACMNLKKLATWMRKSPPQGGMHSGFSLLFPLFLLFLQKNKRPALA